MILVQRESTVSLEGRDGFEERGRDQTWPALLQQGAPMVAFGSWAFAGPTDAMVTHTIYEDFAHWEATREGVADEFDEPVSLARPFELVDGMSQRATRQSPILTLPPTFGRGSLISERTMALADGARDEFIRLSSQIIWPWLESSGGRGIAIGSDLMGASNEITTWFAFPTIAMWHRLTKPATAGAPAAAVDAYRDRQALVRHQRGRLLIIQTDWGTRA